MVGQLPEWKDYVDAVEVKAKGGKLWDRGLEFKSPARQVEDVKRDLEASGDWSVEYVELVDTWDQCPSAAYLQGFISYVNP